LSITYCTQSSAASIELASFRGSSYGHVLIPLKSRRHGQHVLERHAALALVDVLDLSDVKIIQNRRIETGLEVTARHGDSKNDGRHRLADRLHAVQVRALVVGMPRRVEIVVPPSQPGVQRPFNLGFFSIDARIIVRVLPPEDFRAATKDLETVDKTVLSSGEVGIQIRQRPIIEPDAGRCRLVPAPSWPGDGGANIGVTDADAGESRAAKDEEPNHPPDLQRCAHLPNPSVLASDDMS
jgi:hypothetical protein